VGASTYKEYRQQSEDGGIFSACLGWYLEVYELSLQTAEKTLGLYLARLPTKLQQQVKPNAATRGAGGAHFISFLFCLYSLMLY